MLLTSRLRPSGTTGGVSHVRVSGRTGRHWGRSYLQAVQEFCIWAVGGRKKVHLSPLADLEVKVKKTDATRVRRALTLAEVVKLLVVTRHSTREANGSAGLRHADTDQRHARKGPGGGQYTVRG